MTDLRQHCAEHDDDDDDEPADVSVATMVASCDANTGIPLYFTVRRCAGVVGTRVLTGSAVVRGRGLPALL